MPPIEIRPVHRGDRDQLTALVNAHVDAVVPGVSLSPNAVLGQLEREPGDGLVDPWVCDRHTLVAVERGRLVGGVHLLRYRDDESVGPAKRGVGEIRWLLFRPGSDAAADALTAVGLATLRRWSDRAVLADVGLPVPGVHGVPDVWPHVAEALRRAGFHPGPRVEAVLVAAVTDIPAPEPAPIPGLQLQVVLGAHAPCLHALLDGQVVGRYEAASDLTAGGTLSRLAGWAEAWDLEVRPEQRRRGVATWLLGHAAQRWRRAGVRNVLDYAITAPDADVEPGLLPFLAAVGFVELTRTTGPWHPS